MKLFFKFLILLFFSTFNFCSSLSAEEFKEVYIIEIGKIDIGKLIWNIKLNENNYKISIKLEDKGFLSYLYNFDGKYEANGFITNNNLVSTNYNQVWITNKKKRDVSITFNNGSLIELKLFPKEIQHQRIKYIGIVDHLDPLSSFLNILMGKEKSKTIDGRRIYSMNVAEKNSDSHTETKK